MKKMPNGNTEVIIELTPHQIRKLEEFTECEIKEDYDVEAAIDILIKCS